MDKVLTVIIPMYNMEKYLRKCLDSLIIEDNELFGTLEVLVVNDGSRDSSSAIAHEYQGRYPDVFRVIDKENGNYGSCVNRGLKEAAGKYVRVLDADDTFDTENFSCFLNYMADKDVDCVISDMMQVDGLGAEKEICRFNLPEDRSFSLAELGEAVNDLWMHCVCYKAVNLRAMNYRQTEGISYTDQEWICLPMSVCRSLAYFPKVIYRYLVGRDGQTIDPLVWERNFWMEVQGAKEMMKYRDSVHGSMVPDQNFIDLRIKIRMRAIYFAYLIKFSSFSNDELVRDLDSCLMAYDRRMYDDFSAYTYTKKIPVPVVKLWRERRFGLLSIYRKVLKANDFIRGLMK